MYKNLQVQLIIIYSKENIFSLHNFTCTDAATETDEAVLSFKSDSSDYRKLVANNFGEEILKIKDRSTKIYMYDWWAQKCFG